MRRVLWALALAASAAGAQEPDLTADFRARLKALQSPAPVITDPYADEIASDLARISAEAGLFDPARAGVGPEGPPVIALFIGPDCTACEMAREDLAALATRLGIRAVVLDTAQDDNAALMARLGLDTLPSYVMPDRLIRGEMPVFVLERYLTE